jgi:hypothetical protein
MVSQLREATISEKAEIQNGKTIWTMGESSHNEVMDFFFAEMKMGFDKKNHSSAGVSLAKPANWLIIKMRARRPALPDFEKCTLSAAGPEC